MMVVAKQSSRHKMWTEITRRKYEREGQRYASDLTDAEWALIAPHMPAVKRLSSDGLSIILESVTPMNWTTIALVQETRNSGTDRVGRGLRWQASHTA